MSLERLIGMPEGMSWDRTVKRGCPGNGCGRIGIVLAPVN